MTDEEYHVKAWVSKTGFNQMCFRCPVLLEKCIGSKNKTWHVCHRRIGIEREMKKWQETEHSPAAKNR